MMRTMFVAVALLALVASACTQERTSALGGASPTTSARSMVYRPDQIQWKDNPPSLAPGAKSAVLEGDPNKDGYFCVRLKFPDGYIVPPHWHPNFERVTVISGTLHLGMADKFDKANTQTMPAGCYWFMEPGMHHFAWAEGETVLQLATIGPWQINYLNPADDPRLKQQQTAK